MNLEEALDEASLHLRKSAENYANPSNNTPWQQLAAAAESYARARWALKAPPKAAKAKSAVVCPFGRDKGKSISDLDDRGVRWLLGVVSESVDDPDKARFRSQNAALLDALQVEAEERGL